MSKRKIIILIITVIFSIAITGCGDQKIFEQVGFALQAGMESKGDKVVVTITLPVVGEQKSSSLARIITVEDVKGAREARENARMRAPSMVEAGKIQQIVFSSELAEKGIHRLLDVFERDATDPVLAYLVVCEGSPKEMFERIEKFPDNLRPAFYINKLLESNMRKSYIPETRLYNFDIEYYAKGIDPMLPLIKAEEKDIAVIGSALFSDEKMVGTIDTKQTTMLLAMKGKMKPSDYIMLSPNKSVGLSVMMGKAKRKIKLNIVDNKITADISLYFDCDIDEYSIDNLDDPKNQKEIEKYISEQLKHKCEEVLKYTQQVDSDPLGIGNMVRAKYISDLDDRNWDEAYKNIVFNVNVKCNVRHHGVVD